MLLRAFGTHAKHKVPLGHGCGCWLSLSLWESPWPASPKTRFLYCVPNSNFSVGFLRCRCEPCLLGVSGCRGSDPVGGRLLSTPSVPDPVCQARYGVLAAVRHRPAPGEVRPRICTSQAPIPTLPLSGCVAQVIHSASGYSPVKRDNYICPSGCWEDEVT